MGDHPPPRPLRSRIAAVAAAATALVAIGTGAARASAAGSAAFTVRTLHFATTVGPASSREHCDVIGDLYTPADASSSHRVPAVLTTNGFGGSKDDQAGFAKTYAAKGYVVLSYSGLGFGGSGCKITLDDPDFDGQAARQLVSFLGGTAGIAFADVAHTRRVPALDVVQLDHTDHVGHHSAHDPRVGMIGGSYGGGAQFAAAAVDPRIDALVPEITWNDLSYSLAPNNTDLATGVSSPTPGSAKALWALGFSLDGAVVAGLSGLQNDPGRIAPCPNFADWVCPGLVLAGGTGYPDAATTGHLRHASVASFIDRIKVPVLLDQGQVDTLFNLNESVATYQALLRRGVTTRLMWREEGHSGGSTSAAGNEYESARIAAWFDHFLKGADNPLGPPFAYYQDWTGTYSTASRCPAGAPTRFFLSGDGTLVSQPVDVRSGSQGLLTAAGGAPTSLGPTDAVRLPLPTTAAPGTTVAWDSGPLATGLDVIGIPTVDLAVDAPVARATQLAGPPGELVLFLQLYDVAPDGSASSIHGLLAPVRVADATKPFRVTLPGIVHRFAAGHRVRLQIAGGDVDYRGGLLPNLVNITAGSDQVLTLPTVG